MIDIIKNSFENMTVKELIQVIVFIGVIISAILEFSNKLPFNPWTSLLKWIGSKTTQDINEKIENLEKNQKDYIHTLQNDYKSRLDNLEKNLDEKESKRLRSSIICFSDECRVGNKHTKKHFENIFRDYDDYLEYCNKHKFENHFIDEEMNYIHGVYNECLKDNKFL